MMLVTVLLGFVIFVGQSPSVWTQLEEETKKFEECLASADTEVSQCVVSLWMDAKPALIAGIPDRQMPPIDPLQISHLEWTAKGLVQGTAYFEDLIVTGLSNYDVRAATIDPVAKTIILDMHIRELDIDGKYQMNATVMSMPIKGDGKVALKLIGVDNLVRISVGLPVGGDEDVLRLSDLDLSFEVADMQFHLEDLLGNESADKVVNDMLNSNSQKLLASMKPQLTEKLLEVLRGIADVAVQMIPTKIFQVQE